MIPILCYKTKGYIAFSCQIVLADCFISVKLLNTFPTPPPKTVQSFEFSSYSFFLPHQRQFIAKFLLILPLNIWFICLPSSIFTATILSRSSSSQLDPFNSALTLVSLLSSQLPFYSISQFLNLSTTGIWGQIILCCRRLFLL